MLSKIKNSRLAKWLTVASITCMIAVFGALSVFAEGDESVVENSTQTTDLTSTVSSSFNSISDSIFTYIGIALPIALGIVAAIFGIKFAIRFFKSVASK